MISGNNYGHGGDIYKNEVRLDFSANVNPLGTPVQVKQAICRAAEKTAVYPDPYCTQLREMLAEKNGTDAENILCGNGAAELIFQFAAALRPQKALVPVPSFSEYDAALRAAGCVPDYYELKRENRFAVLPSLAEKVTEDTDVLMLCSPNNPTGQCIKPGVLNILLRKCRETGTWLFLDECFLDLSDSENAVSLLPELRENDRVFLLRAFTKLYGMAGVRLGYGICRNAQMRKAMCMQTQPWNVSCIAQEAGKAALGCTDFVKMTKELIAKEKQYLMHELSVLGVKTLPAAANFIFFSGGPDWYEKLLKKKILIRSCANYRGLACGDYRIAVRTHEENVQLIAALKEIVYEADGN